LVEADFDEPGDADFGGFDDSGAADFGGFEFVKELFSGKMYETDFWMGRSGKKLGWLVEKVPSAPPWAKQTKKKVDWLVEVDFDEPGGADFGGFDDSGAAGFGGFEFVKE
jgi:hypothetical protein